nr:DUF559 domain-containing protein [Gordonia rubripertincta]
MPAYGYIIDFAIPHVKVAVEIDGFAFHRDAAAFRRDRLKRNLLVANGWTVLNFTWADLVERSTEIVDEVRAARQRAAS